MNYVFDEKGYLKNLKQKNSANFFIITFLIIILLLSLAVYLNQLKEKSFHFYFLEVGNFLNYTKAKKNAEELQNSGYAGYIYFDGSYHVFAKLSLTLKEAESEIDRYKSTYPLTKIFKFSTTPNSVSKLPKAQAQTAKKIANEMPKILNMVNVNLENFCSGKLTQVGTKIEFENILNRFNLIDDLSGLSAHKQFQNIQNNISNISADLSYLANTNEFLSYEINYKLINIAINFNSFLGCF